MVFGCNIFWGSSQTSYYEGFLLKEWYIEGLQGSVRGCSWKVAKGAIILARGVSNRII